MLNIQKKMSSSFFALLSLPATAMGFGLSVQISALSWILSTVYGLDISQIGIVWAAGPIAGIIAQPIVGLISDKLWFMGGRRRPWIVIGGILTGLMLLALPNLGIIQQVLSVGADGLLALAVVVALTLDLSINVSFNPTRSIISDCTTDAQRAKGYTWMQTVSGTCGVLAYLIAIIWGNIVLIYVGVAVALLFTVVPVFFIEEPKQLENQAAAAESKSSVRDVVSAILPLLGFLIYGIYVIVVKLAGIQDATGCEIMGVHLSAVELLCIAIEVIAIIMVLLNVLKEKSNNHEFQKILLAHSFTWWGVQTMNVYMFFYVCNIIFGGDAGDASQKVTSWSFFVRDIVGAVLPVLVLNVIAAKQGMTRTHMVSILLMALGYAAIYFFGSKIAIFFVALAIVGIGWASLVSLPFAIMSTKVDPAKMGLYMGIFNLSVVLPQLVASFKMGEIINNAADKSIIFAICAICLLISGVLWAFVKNDK